MSHADILQFVEENDVKFIRLAFCDLQGNQKNIAITVERLTHVLQHGLRFDGSLIPSFAHEGIKDLYLHPMPETMRILPWRPQQGRVLRLFCHIRQADGSPFAYDARLLLENAISQYHKEGLSCQVGSKASFYLLLTDEHGNPTSTPLDKGGYLDVAPLDRGENVRRETCLMLENMGIATENSLHAQGPGQNAIALHHHDPLQAADDLLTFQSVTSMAAVTNGLYASFEGAPLEKHAQNWLHVNISLHKDGGNLYEMDPSLWERFAGGIRRRIAEILPAVYPGASSPNAEDILRVPPAHASGESHLQIQLPCAHANPYWLLTLLFHAGLEGISGEKNARATSTGFVASNFGAAFHAPFNHNSFQA